MSYKKNRWHHIPLFYMEQQIVKSDNVAVVPLYFSVFDIGAGDQYFIKTQWETDIVRASRGNSVSPSK